MSLSAKISNGVLWAASIIASAIMDAPVFLTLTVLPVLAVCSFLTLEEKIQANACAKRTSR